MKDIFHKYYSSILILSFLPLRCTRTCIIYINRAVRASTAQYSTVLLNAIWHKHEIKSQNISNCNQFIETLQQIEVSKHLFNKYSYETSWKKSIDEYIFHKSLLIGFVNFCFLIFNFYYSEFHDLVLVPCQSLAHGCCDDACHYRAESDQNRIIATVPFC